MKNVLGCDGKIMCQQHLLRCQFKESYRLASDYLTEISIHGLGNSNQPKKTCSKLITETLEQGFKYVQS